MAGFLVELMSMIMMPRVMLERAKWLLLVVEENFEKWDRD